MLGKLVSAVVTAFGGGGYRVSLTRQPGAFVMQAFQGNHAVPVPKAATKFEGLKPFVALPSQPDGSMRLPPSFLGEAKAILRALGGQGLETRVSPDIDAIRLIEVPEGFRVKYIWDAGNRCLRRQITDEAIPFGEGWFVGRDCYWQILGALSEDDWWLGRATIEGPDILTLINRVAPIWQQRRLPYGCDTRIEQAPALKLTVKQVLDDAVEMEVVWRVPQASVQEVPSLPGYVVADNALMPGISPQAMMSALPAASGSLRIAGQQIPRFMRDTWSRVRSFATGYAEELARGHCLLEGNAELLLTVSSQMREGLGVVTATPVVSAGGTQMDAAEVSRQLDIRTDYVRTASAWIPRSSVKGLGIGPMGRLDDGTPLEPLKLNFVEVLNRGSERLDGPWSRIEFPELRLPKGNSAAETARLHVEFLRKWRIPGGVVSTSPEVLRAVAESVVSVVGQFPGAKILVLGTKETLGRLADLWAGCRALRLDGLKKDPKIPPGFRGLVAASPRALETAPELLRSQWAIVCLLEADTLVRSDTSKFFANLRSCRKSLILGHFGGTDFLNRTAAREALSQIFHVDNYGSTMDLFEKYGLRDPAKAPPALPTPYQVRHRASRSRQEATPAEITLGSQPSPAGLSIPPRPAVAPARETETRTVLSKGDLKIELRVEYGRSTSHRKFVEDARRLAEHREKKAAFVPFMCYWPTYDSMTAAQRTWYFYWRGQARDGNYIDTDLSYIFVHVYELINNVGVRNATEGYQQLWRLWMGYRERYPKLDNYLADWLTDYLLVNRFHPEAIRAHIEALPLGVGLRDPDLFLCYYLGTSPLHLPLALVEALSDYRVGRSKFFLDGNTDLLSRAIPQVLEGVNQHLLSGAGVGIFDLFKPRTTETVRRLLFASAVYAGSSTQLADVAVIPYSQHRPLREFLTALVKHTENRLRELNGFEGKLRGYSLDPTVQAVIDELLGFQAKVPASRTATARPRTEVRTVAPPPKVVIDMAKVQDLERESDQVRDLLLGTAETTESEVKPAIETQVAPPEKVVELQTDQDPIGAFLARLTDDERRLVGTVAAYGWEASEEALRQTLPGLLLEPLIDRINENAYGLLGDLLIAWEEDLLIISDDLRGDLSGHLEAGRTEEMQAAAGRGTAADLPGEWAAFSSGLKAYQLDALQALVELADPMPAIKSIAENNAIMPGLLIDSINELALDTIGDSIIEPGSEPPALEDEDREMVTRVVAALAAR